MAPLFLRACCQLKFKLQHAVQSDIYSLIHVCTLLILYHHILVLVFVLVLVNVTISTVQFTSTAVFSEQEHNSVGAQDHKVHCAANSPHPPFSIIQTETCEAKTREAKQPSSYNTTRDNKWSWSVWFFVSESDERSIFTCQVTNTNDKENLN